VDTGGIDFLGIGNVLNTLVALIGTDPKLAQTMVSRSSELLRRILSDGATPTSTALLR
jgi:LytS/YehU family sensor histidine kinase